MRSATTYFKWLAGGYTLFLTYLLLTPAPLWGMGTTGQEIEQSVDLTVSGFTQHFVAYALLATLFVSTLQRRTAGGVFMCVMLAAVHGLSAEGLQAFVPLRCCDWPDALANCLGACSIGLLVGLTVIISKQTTRDQEVLSPQHENS